MKKISWDEVTSLSQIVAVALFVGVFAVGFWLGTRYEYHAFVNAKKAIDAEENYGTLTAPSIPQPQ